MTAALARDFAEGGPPDFLRALRLLLRELAETARAQGAWLVDRNGQLLASLEPEADSTALASRLARRLTPCDRARLLAGEGLSLRGSVHLRILAGCSLAVLCFEAESLTEEVAAALERASGRLERLQQDAARAGYATFPALSAEDLENLLRE